MTRSRFDLALWGALLLICAALVIMPLRSERPAGAAGEAQALDRALERSLKYQARIALIRDLYAPVEALRQTGQTQGALLKLAELEKSYPGEAHGRILQGEIQAQLGALDEAVASYAAGVRLNGDYIERDNPLSQRPAIQRLVASGLADVEARLAANPDNRTTLQTRKELYYLQSRLAGGCE